MNDFYFAYDYDEINNNCSKLCRRVNYNFQIYHRLNHAWVDRPDLGEIYIGVNIFYDVITKEQAELIILKIK